MFTEESVFKNVVEKSRKDISDFFDSDFKFDFDHTNYTSFLDSLRQIDPTYFTHRFNQMGSLEVVDNFLRWLEDTRNERRYPWEERGGTLQLSQDENVRKIKTFLTYLKGWINQLILPGRLSLPGALPPPPYIGKIFPGDKSSEFKNFIGKRRLIQGAWDIYFHEANDEEKTLLKDFVSWLVLVRSQPVLYIVYNKEKILDSSNEWVVQRERFRRIILHELGHACTELPWYIDQVNAAQDTTWVSSFPIHEYKAWLYAFTIRSLLVCTRSRVTRFIEYGDTEWLSYV
jgi:hypothetical protein